MRRVLLLLGLFSLPAYGYSGNPIVTRAYSISPLGKNFKSCLEWKQVFGERVKYILQANEESARLHKLLQELVVAQNPSKLTEQIKEVEARFNQAIEMARNVDTNPFFDEVDAAVYWRLNLLKYASPVEKAEYKGKIDPVSKKWDKIETIRATASFVFHDPISALKIENDANFVTKFAPNLTEVGLKVTPIERCMVDSDFVGLAPTGKPQPPTPFYVGVTFKKEGVFYHYPSLGNLKLDFYEDLVFRLDVPLQGAKNASDEPVFKVEPCSSDPQFRKKEPIVCEFWR